MDLHNLNDTLEVLDGMSLSTSAGRFVRMEDVRRLMAQAEIEDLAQTEREEEMSFKTWEEARYAAKEYLQSLSDEPLPIELGRAVSAFESPSAVEGV